MDVKQQNCFKIMTLVCLIAAKCLALLDLQQDKSQI